MEQAPLGSNGARSLLSSLLETSSHPSAVAATLGLLQMRSLSVEELLAFREGLMERATKVRLSDRETLDVVGTGGDKKGSINLSTLSALVIAGAGVPVTKHGNYGATSRSGASTVMEALGVRLSADPEYLRSCLEQAGFCYLHAPLFHPALKSLAQVRRELPFLTLFNILGPLCNPASPAAAVLGASQSAVARLYSQAARKLFKRFAVVHSLDGFDEVSLTAPCRIFTESGEQLMSAADFNLAPPTISMLQAEKDTGARAKQFFELLRGRNAISSVIPLQREVVIAGAAVGIRTFNPNFSLSEATERARESLYSGGAFRVLEKVRELGDNL